LFFYENPLGFGFACERKKGSSGNSVLPLMDTHDSELEKFYVPEAVCLPFYCFDFVVCLPWGQTRWDDHTNPGYSVDVEPCFFPFSRAAGYLTLAVPARQKLLENPLSMSL
jgi:hypothetical protein